MTMRRSIWTYAWDLQDLGLDIVTCGDAGTAPGSIRSAWRHPTMPGVSCSRAVRAPRSTFRRTARSISIRRRPGGRGAQSSRRWPTSSPRGATCSRDLVRRRDAGGLLVSCWTVCLHNTRLGLLHPEATTVSAFGDPNPFSLCPSNPAREPMCARSSQTSPAATGLTGSSSKPHPSWDTTTAITTKRTASAWLPEEDFIFSLCFCQSCLSRAAKAGVDGMRARHTVRRYMVETCERETPAPRFPDFPQAGIDAFGSVPELHAYLLWRFEPVTSLVAEIRNAADPATQVVIIDLRDGWLAGCDAAALGTQCDGLILCAYDMEPAGVAELIGSGRKVFGPGKVLGAGFRLFYPEMSGREASTARTVPRSRLAPTGSTSTITASCPPRGSTG